MFRLLRNIPLWMKGAFITVITIVSLAGASQVARMGMAEIDGKLRIVSDEMVPELQRIATTENTIQKAHMDFLKTLSWASGGVDGEAMETQLAKTYAELDSVQAMILEHRETTPNPLIAAVEVELETYVTEARDALDLASFDPVTGFLVAITVTDNYDAMTLVRATETEARQLGISDSVAGMVHSSKVAQQEFLTVVSIAIVLCLIIITLTIMSVTRPIGKMTQAMKKLARHELDVFIPGEGLTNEMGQMANAVGVFRDNAKERDRLEAAEKRAQEVKAKEKAERESQEQAEAARKAQEKAEREEAERAAHAEVEARAKQSDLLQEEMGKVIGAACHGDFSSRIESSFEIANLESVKSKVNALVEAVDYGVSHTAEILKSLAQGDLTARMDGEFEGAFDRLQNDANSTADRLEQAILQISQSTEQIRDTSTNIAEGGKALSMRTQSQAATLEETSAAMQEMAASIKNNAEGSQGVLSLAQEANERATQGRGVAESAISSMTEIEASSAKVSEVVSVINSIAHQTNLLSLNASVEAARAGDAGKGFAVVAMEVRNLAMNAHTAANEIASLIEESTNRVAVGVREVGEFDQALENICDRLASLVEIADGISHATSEQSVGVQEISTAVVDVDRITQENAELAERSSESSAVLSEEMRSLAELVGAFRVGAKAKPAEKIAS